VTFEYAQETPIPTNFKSSARTKTGSKWEITNNANVECADRNRGVAFQDTGHSPHVTRPSAAGAGLHINILAIRCRKPLHLILSFRIDADNAAFDPAACNDNPSINCRCQNKPLKKVLLIKSERCCRRGCSQCDCPTPEKICSIMGEKNRPDLNTARCHTYCRRGMPEFFGKQTLAPFN